MKRNIFKCSMRTKVFFLISSGLPHLYFESHKIFSKKSLYNLFSEYSQLALQDGTSFLTPAVNDKVG